MKEKTLKLFCILLFFCSSINAQREAANWFFGVNAGLDFNSGIPTQLNTSQVNTLEGCSTISDENGAMLFYTDGVTVWNSLHQIMSNGTDLNGSFSSTQSSIVVPNPANDNIYYIFTTDVVDAYDPTTNTSNGFNYSVVDISLDGGLGAVTDKNVNLMPNTSEKVSATLSNDGNYWVVTHYLDSFYAFKITAAGVNTVPVVSATSFNVNNYRNFRGNMKISPDGKKLAIAHAYFFPDQEGYLYLYDFNDETGIVQNSDFLGDNLVYYGVEFSSNSSKLYASAKVFSADNSVSNIQLQQYDVNAPNVANTRYIVHNYPQSQVTPSLGGSLQIGFDKRVYHSLPGSTLSTINTPNLSGFACSFELASVDLGTNFARFGLPSYVQTYFESIATIQNLCLGQQTTFTVAPNPDILSIDWDFGDVASGANNTSTQMSPSHLFTSAGLYIVTADVAFASEPNRTFIEVIQINEVPNIAASFTLFQCDVDDNPTDGLSIFNLGDAQSLIQADSGISNAQVIFYPTLNDAQNNQNAINNLTYFNTQSDQILYARVFSQSECFAITQVRLTANPGTSLGTYTTLDVCETNANGIAISQIENTLGNDFPGGTISVFATESGALLQQNQLSDNAQVNLTNNELFFRVDYGTNCGFIGSISINVIAQPQVEDQQVTLCGGPGSEVTLALDESFSNYTWSTNETTPTITVSEVGTYMLTISNAAGCEREVSFVVIEEPPIEIEEILVSDFQDQNSIKIILTQPTETILYSINGGQTFSDSNEFNNLFPGVYDIVVKRENCDSVGETVLVGGLPKFFTPNGDNINDTWTLLRKEFYPNAIIELYDRYGKNLDYIKADDREWDGTYRGNPLPSGDYWYKLTLENGKVIKGNVTLKR
ncbi:T9SS type B sorting domain-containing protein [Kordia jejudonensis]|uniref:T9SS type B sorting domain-containing protein n=1 Tax=Kordia jejudonensis TaxID=1348245 RepID=UPI00138E0C14|nr:T9SS type B sorting domain-containing protein [Kordia jejudonensis]